jgi:hypothetical protein
MAECKYYKQVRQVSYDNGVTWISLDEYQKGDLYENDSPDCGGGITQYKWVNVSGEYTCVGTTKYQKTKKQQSTDGGQTWTDVNPPEYNTGAVIERDSSDCSGGGDYENQYLTFVARERTAFMFNRTIFDNAIEYSVDNGSTWVYLPPGAGKEVDSGQKIMWRGNMTSDGGVGQFLSSGLFEVEGNIMSLLYGDNFRGQTSLSGKDYVFKELFSNSYSSSRLTSIDNLVLPATTLANNCYYGMFLGCTSLTSVPSNLLPATTLAECCYQLMFYNCTSLASIPSGLLPATTLAIACYESMFGGCTRLTSIPSNLLLATTLASSCYANMFHGCTSLTTAPQLPSTSLTYRCYYAMFYGCTSLTTAPSLPATTLAQECYYSMFASCSSLTAAPDLLATTLQTKCYQGMFASCSSLNYVKCLATNISATDCTTSWLYNVSSSGTFVKSSSMSGWSSGVSGIPTNWTVQNA